MAFSFTPEKPVLYFGPRKPRHHARWASREYLLWPAWAYRVVAPRVRQRQLNILQRAVLGLCRGGVTAPADIGEKLAVDKGLANQILRELGLDENTGEGLGFLDETRGLTEEGLRVLEDEAIEKHDMVGGYVFQDPWNGELWPRFVEQLDYCELEYSADGFPALMLGTTGTPRRHWAHAVLPKVTTAPATPSARSIVEAVSRHRKGLRFSDADEDPGDDFGAFVASGVQVDRVSYVEEEPQPVFLATYLYVPESDAEVTDWYACDPFGLGLSVRLRRRVERVMQDMKGLYGVVDRLVGKAGQDGYEEQRRWIEQLSLQAGLEVEKRLTVNIRSHPTFVQILAMESARQEVRSLGDACPPRKIDEVLRSGVKVLEACFSAMADEHRLGDAWKRGYTRQVDRRTGRHYFGPQRDRQLLEAVYRSAIHAVGFDESIPAPFLWVKPGDLKATAKHHKHWKLRALITATVLRADRDESHPLREIAALHPNLLIEIHGVTSLGGGAGHANNTPSSLADAERQVETVYSLVTALLGLGGPGTTSSINPEGGLHGEA